MIMRMFKDQLKFILAMAPSVIDSSLETRLSKLTTVRLFVATVLAFVAFSSHDALAEGRTNAAPAAALVGNNHDYLFAVAKGLDGNVYVNQGELGKPFVGWGRSDFQTDTAPGAAPSGNNTVVVAKDKEGRIFYNWWKLGEARANGARSCPDPRALTINGQHASDRQTFTVTRGQPLAAGSHRWHMGTEHDYQ
jgi:hypothetical protein